MAPTVVVALIGSLTAIVLAATTAAFQRRDSKRLKQYELQLRMVETASQRRLAHVEAVKSSLVDACRALQSYRDALAVLLENNGAILGQSALDRLEKAQRDVLETFQRIHASIPTEERLAFHRAKSLVVEVTAGVNRTLAGQSGLVALAAAETGSLAECRATLRELQHGLMLSALSNMTTPDLSGKMR